MSYQNNKTDEQKFEDYLEDEYQAAIKDNDEYYEQQEDEQEIREPLWESIIRFLLITIIFSAPFIGLFLFRGFIELMIFISGLLGG